MIMQRRIVRAGRLAGCHGSCAGCRGCDYGIGYIPARGIGNGDLDLPVYDPSTISLTPTPAPSPWAGIIPGVPIIPKPKPLPASIPAPIIMGWPVGTLPNIFSPTPTAAGSGAPWQEQEFISGVKNKMLLWGGLAIAGLAMLRGGGGRGRR